MRLHADYGGWSFAVLGLPSSRVRALMLALMFAAVVLPPCKLRAAPATGPTHVLVVGQPIAFKPPTLPVSIICDDLSVVRVEDAGTFLRITGLRPGATSCSVGSPQRPGLRQIHHFDVRSP
jgi:hypothetical protein